MQRLLVTIPMSARVYAHQFKYFFSLCFSQMILRVKKTVEIHHTRAQHEKHETQENQDIAQMRKHQKRDNDAGDDDDDDNGDDDGGW